MTASKSQGSETFVAEKKYIKWLLQYKGQTREERLT